MLPLLATNAAECIQRQIGREYRFPANDDKELRAADLSKIPYDTLLGAPTNDLITERHLSVLVDVPKRQNLRQTNILEN